MLRMGAPCQEGDLHIRKRRTSQHADMFLLLQMCKDQTLPVPCKHIFTACGKKLAAASRLSRLDQKMDFRIMTKRLKMSHSFHRFCNGFFVDNASCTEFHCYMKTVPDQFLEDLDLHLSHQLCMDLAKLAVPQNMKFRFLFLKLS